VSPRRGVQAIETAAAEPLDELERARRRQRVQAVLSAEHAYLQGLARRLCRGQLDPEDLVQDTVAAALASADRVADADNPVAWLTRVMTNRFLDRCRRQQVRNAVAATDAAPDEVAAHGAEPAAWWQELGLEDLRAAVQQLPGELATAYSLHAFDGLDYETIATRMRIPRGTVATRLLRARRMLRDLLTTRAGGVRGGS
jgi:RNA polymerase sigma-70 factor (ECF subfamily)